MDFLIKIYDQLSISWSKVKFLIKDLYGFLFIKIYFIINLVINVFLWYGSYFMYRRISQDVAILHYNVDFGIDLIGNKNYFFIIPLLSLLFIILNKMFLLFLLKKDDFKFLSYFLLSFLSLFNILLILSLFAIFIINF